MSTNELVPFVNEGLGNSSYLLGVGGHEAVLIDPDRTAARYAEEAERRSWRIVAAFETHLHADFVTGAIEVRERTGAVVHAAAGAGLGFPHRGLEHGDRVEVGDVEVEAVASPGHTPEHLAYVVRSDAAPPKLFSGGALIPGGAARTDLISPELTDPLTRELFRTLHGAFDDLPDETLVLPTHGGGSFCSVGSTDGERTSVLGSERRTNPLLLATDEDAFASWFPSTFPGAPDYFFRMREVNRAGPAPVASIEPPPRLDPSAFVRARDEGALVLDVRSHRRYAQGHVPGALAIPFVDHAFSTWLGWLVASGTALLFVTDEVPVGAVVDASLLVGYERFAGVLDEGMPAWRTAGLPEARLTTVGPDGMSAILGSGALAVDVREPVEFEQGHVEGALHVPLGSFEDRVGGLPRDRTIVTYCGGGDRSSSAASILERAGFGQVVKLEGGFDAWQEASANR